MKDRHDGVALMSYSRQFQVAIVAQQNAHNPFFMFGDSKYKFIVSEPFQILYANLLFRFYYSNSPSMLCVSYLLCIRILSDSENCEKYSPFAVEW